MSEHDGSTCHLCQHAVEHGWYGMSRGSHCRDCGRTWTSMRQAHCSTAGCHRHFSSPSTFDFHFGKAGEHRDPVQKNREFRQDPEGIWYKAQSNEARWYEVPGAGPETEEG